MSDVGSDAERAEYAKEKKISIVIPCYNVERYPDAVLILW